MPSKRQLQLKAARKKKKEKQGSESGSAAAAPAALPAAAQRPPKKQDAKPRVRRADDQICLGQRNDAALSKHANPQKTGRQPSALFSSQKLQAVKPFLVCCCPLCFLCLLLSDSKHT